MMFQHHPDGNIHIDDVVIPLAVFMLLEPDYALPPGGIGRIYKPGECHTLFSSNSAWPQDEVWPAGDIYISRREHYRRMYLHLTRRNCTPLLKRKVKRLWQ